MSTNDSNDMDLQTGNIIHLNLVDIEANEPRDFNLDEADLEREGQGLRITSPNLKSQDPSRLFNYS